MKEKLCAHNRRASVLLSAKSIFSAVLSLIELSLLSRQITSLDRMPVVTIRTAYQEWVTEERTTVRCWRRPHWPFCRMSLGEPVTVYPFI
jgi:hypothetical protein